MSKEDMIAMLRGVGCDENTVIAMSNAYDFGFDYAKENMLALPVVELPLEKKMTNEQLAKALAYVLAQIAIKEAKKK